MSLKHQYLNFFYTIFVPGRSLYTIIVRFVVKTIFLSQKCVISMFETQPIKNHFFWKVHFSCFRPLKKWKDWARAAYKVSIASDLYPCSFKTIFKVITFGLGLQIQCLMLLTLGGDEITHRVCNFVTPTEIKKRGPRWWQRPKKALPSPRPPKNVISYRKKIWGYLHEFLRKKLICVKKVTKLPPLTVCTIKPGNFIMFLTQTTFFLNKSFR